MPSLYKNIIYLLITIFCLGCDPNNYVAPTSDSQEVNVDDPAQAPWLGKGVFTFDTYEPLANKPVNVFYYVPQNATTDSPIVFVFHGTNRNAEDYRDAWISKAEEYGVMVFAPEFRTAFYAGSSGYNLGNVFTNGESPTEAGLNDSSVWTFSMIEPLFDEIVSHTQNNSDAYYLFGHSAGGQFVHRFVLFMPDARYDKAISSNSGWYTMPDANIEFPYGLGVTPITSSATSYFARELIVQIGELDTNPESAALRHTAEADAQGQHRYERAYYFFNESKVLAEAMDAEFAWKIIEVPDTGHDNVKTSRHAADYLFD